MVQVGFLSNVVLSEGFTVVTRTNLNFLAETDPAIAEIIQQELQRQRDHLELIASENFTSAAVLAAQGLC